METTQDSAIHKAQQPHQMETICRNIDELVSNVLSSNDAIVQSHTISSAHSASLIRAEQDNILKTFRELMIEVQRRASKAMHEVESKLGPSAQAGLHLLSITNALLDLPGVDPQGELNRVLGRTELDGKHSYKLRDFESRLPSATIVPRIVIDDGTTTTTTTTTPLSTITPTSIPSHTTTILPPSHSVSENHVIVLQPTLRNVWVVQHAYAKLLGHKENLIKRYLATAELGAAASRKFSREYYEDLSLANLPSKNRLGNLLDIKSSTFHRGDVAGDTMIVLVSMPPDDDRSGPAYTEAVTGNMITTALDSDNGDGSGGGGAHLTVPVTEASILKLYNAYKALRKATSEQRRASKDKLFAATLPVDEVDELERKFNFTGAADGGAGGDNTSRKRRRMLDDIDEDGRG